MFDQIFDAIEEWMRGLLTGIIHSNLDRMFTDVNEKTSEIAVQVGQTPQGWNSSIFSMIENLSETGILPIAGIIITFVLCYELISMIIDKNNMHDIDTWMFVKWVFKAGIAIFVINHTFDCIRAIFDGTQNLVQKATGVIDAQASIDITAALASITTELEAMGTGELFGLMMETFLMRFALTVMGVCIMIILYGRMIEIFIYASVGPLPFATFANREWGNIGTNYVRGLAALGLQGFLIMVCVAIYAALVKTLSLTGGNIHAVIWGCAAYTMLLCFSLFKSGGVAKSILHAH